VWGGGPQWRKDVETVVRAALGTIVLIVCLWVVFSGNYSEVQVNFASGLIGAILGYYLK
jgi:hypothetical protein